MPIEKREAVDWIHHEKGLSVKRACEEVGMSRSGWYRPSTVDPLKDEELRKMLEEITTRLGR